MIAATSSCVDAGPTNDLQSRYERLMNSDYGKQLDEIGNNLRRIEKTQSRSNMNIFPKRVMWSQDVKSPVQ